jgi:hypothetical protein
MAITVTDPRPIDRAEEILTPKALAFIEELHKRFAGTRGELLTARGVKRQTGGGHQPPGLPAGDPGRARRRLEGRRRHRQLCRTAALR